MGDTDQQELTDDFDAVASAPESGNLAAPPGSYDWIVAVSALGDRAEQLRTKMLEKLNTERGELDIREAAASRAQAMAEKGVEEAEAEATAARKQVETYRATATDLDTQADDAELNNDLAAAQELREQAGMARAAGERAAREATAADEAATQLRTQVAAHRAEAEALNKRLDEQKTELQAAEQAIDAIEKQVGHLWEVDHYRTNAATLEKEAATLRTEGRTAEADAKAAEAAKALAAADASQKAADAVVVDDAAFAKAGLDVTASTPTASEDAGPTTGTTGTDDVGARAQALRAELQRKYADSEISQRRDDLSQDKQMTEAAAEAAEADAVRRQKNADDYTKRAENAERDAAALEGEGKTAEAEERREDASQLRAAATRDTELAQRATDVAKQHRAEAETIGHKLDSVQEEWTRQQEKLSNADKAVDALEDKARHLDEAKAHDERALQLQREAEGLRDEGKVKDAYLRERRAEQEVEAADRARAAAEAIEVDQTALTDAGLDAGTAAAPPASDSTAAGQVSPETTALEAHATQLRQRILEKQQIDRANELSEINEAKRMEAATQKVLETAEADAKEARAAHDEWLEKAKEFDALAAEAETRGDPGTAQEMREEADTFRATAVRDLHVAERAEAAVAKHRQELEDQTAGRKALEDTWATAGKALGAAENAVDAIERKVAFMREADIQGARAAELETEARALRAQGNDAAAAVRERQAARATEAAATAQRASGLVELDDAALTAIGLQPLPAPTPAGSATNETSPSEEQSSPGGAGASDAPDGSVDADVDDLVTAGADASGADSTAEEPDVDVTGAADVAAAADEPGGPAEDDPSTAEAAAPGPGPDEPAFEATVEPEPEREPTFVPEPEPAPEPAFEPDVAFESEPPMEADADGASGGEPPALDEAGV